MKRPLFMKKVTIYSVITIVLIYTIATCTSCCPPAYKITNGQALQKWEKRHKWGKRTATIRVMWIRKTGPYYKVRFENKRETMNSTFKGLPAWCVEGNWIPIDSISKHAL